MRAVRADVWHGRIRRRRVPISPARRRRTAAHGRSCGTQYTSDVPARLWSIPIEGGAWDAVIFADSSGRAIVSTTVSAEEPQRAGVVESGTISGPNTPVRYSNSHAHRAYAI